MVSRVLWFHRLRVLSSFNQGGEFKSVISLSSSSSSWSNMKDVNKRKKEDDEVKISSQFKTQLTDFELCFAHVSTSELIKRCITFTLCRSPLFAKHSLKLFTDGRRLVGVRLFDLVVRPFTYSLFVGGGDGDELRESFDDLLQCSLLPLLSPMLETLPNEKDEDNKDLSLKMREENAKKILQCVIFYADNFQQLDLRPLAIKLSAFMSLRNLELLSQRLKGCSVDERLIDNVALLMGLRDEEIEEDECHVSLDMMDSEFREECRSLLSICKLCASRGVTLFIDAEYSWLQPAVRLMTLALMSHFNREGQTLVANTYQCYLTSSLSDILNDLDLSMKKDFLLACKIVRGAYMQVELDRSSRLEQESPLCKSYQATNINYDKVVNVVLEAKRKNGKDNLIVLATHNEMSVLKAIDKMNQLDNVHNVHFAQQRAMGDSISSTLIRNGFSCWKLLPYGTMDELLPWLARRVQENFDAVRRTEHEVKLMQRELRRRLFSKLPLNRN